MLTMNHSDWQTPIQDCIFSKFISDTSRPALCCGLKQMGLPKAVNRTGRKRGWRVGGVLGLFINTQECGEFKLNP